MTNNAKRIYMSGLFGLTVLLAASTASAQTCVKAPDCAEIGFTKTAADCEGKTILKCPFDTNQVYCPGYEESTKTYKVGDTYYKDGITAGVVAVVTDGGLHGIIVSQNTVPGKSVAEVQRSCSSKTTGGLEWGIASCRNYIAVKNVIQSTLQNLFVTEGCTYSVGSSSCNVDAHTSDSLYGCKEAGGYCQASF